jgi:hypothetical protein
MLYQLDKKEGKSLGSIHMQVAKVQPDKNEKLVIHIFNGTNEILIRASSIKDMVDWTNALLTA